MGKEELQDFFNYFQIPVIIFAILASDISYGYFCTIMCMYIGFMWQRKSFMHVNGRPYPLRDARILGPVMVSCHQNPDQQQGLFRL